jgi:excisionase family DNA binding protein
MLRDRDEQEVTGVFVRLPTPQARLLDRAAAAVPAHKKDLISGLLARHLDPDSPEGLEKLRSLTPATAVGSRRIVVEAEDSGMQRGYASFNPLPPPEVLDARAAADLFDVDVDLVVELAEKGELPGRKLGEGWRFARQGLLDWLSHAEHKSG